MPRTIPQVPSTSSSSPLQLTNVAGFNRNITQFANAIGVAPEKAVKKIAFGLLGRMIRKTPRDTGRAKASWNVGIGSPDSTIPPPGQYQDTVAEQRGRGLIEGIDRALPVVWITSNLPYIAALENGHSQQAPQGMVKISIAEEQAKFQEVWAEVFR